mgnify:FL=1
MYIQLTNVSKKIKSNDILKDINLRMESGKIYGFKGKNGCGKTMLMRAISGLIKVKGTVDINGQIIGKDIDDEYLRQVHTISIDPEVIKRQKDLKIVYTPIHGTGMMLIPRALKMWGFENVFTVPEQMIKDGNFPTVVSPIPRAG